MLGLSLGMPEVDAAEHKVIALSLVKGAVRDVPNDTVRVKEGDDVELRWTSDRPVTLHLHGYEIDAKVAAGYFTHYTPPDANELALAKGRGLNE